MSDKRWAAVRSDVESDEYTTVVYQAIRPRKQDFWRVLRGQYIPKVERREILTLKGYDRMLREVWSKENIEKQMLDKSWMMLDGGTVDAP